MFKDDVYVTLLLDFLHYDSEARFMNPTFNAQYTIWFSEQQGIQLM